MILRFVHKYAAFFAILAGVIVATVFVPDEVPRWQALAVGLPVTLAVHWLLFRYGVTRGTEPRR